MSEWLTDLKQLNIGKIETDASLKKFTTYKIGGKARCVIYPKNTEKLVKLMKFIRSKNIKYKMLGNGSNLIFSDDLFDGILIKLTEFDNIEIINNKINVLDESNLMESEKFIIDRYKFIGSKEFNNLYLKTIKFSLKEKDLIKPYTFF